MDVNNADEIVLKLTEKLTPVIENTKKTHIVEVTRGASKEVVAEIFDKIFDVDIDKREEVKELKANIAFAGDLRKNYRIGKRGFIGKLGEFAATGVFVTVFLYVKTKITGEQ